MNWPWKDLPPLPQGTCATDFFLCLDYVLFKVLNIIIVLSFVLSAVFIAWAGISYITKSSEEEIRKNHKRILWAILGFILSMLAYGIVVTLENAIRNELTPSFPSSPNNEIHFISPPPWEAPQRDSQPPIPFIYPNKDSSLALEKKFFNFLFFSSVLAQSLPIQGPWNELKCGNNISIPSVLRSVTTIKTDLWKQCLIFYLQRIIKLLYFLSLTLGVLFLAWAGILYITNQDPEKIGNINRKILWGIIGIVLAILSFFISKVIELFFIKIIPPY